MDNLFSSLPTQSADEVFTTLVSSSHCRIERIVSFGQTTPEGQWYDQDEHEWVMLLSGSAELSFADGTRIALKPGDYVTIPAHVRHRVEHTALNEVSVWLAVFYR
ncbi:cupin domain-containing protein [Shewanella sp. JM162201]|uniref:Cupin domain-containing protein n=1 Tax=Shewanella jiangmenensis TaxID=2837387 RepID=A0ABS5V1N7_9GAMM|nr:cupin domain-containing protein [Shewanella jiangmenensis]MBT1444330.1 cupin domain-containing protein [Shewanella jiangmenensis]